MADNTNALLGTRHRTRRFGQLFENQNPVVGGATNDSEFPISENSDDEDALPEVTQAVDTFGNGVPEDDPVENYEGSRNVVPSICFLFYLFLVSYLHVLDDHDEENNA
jgi:hypothetical protein